ncbi:magnesium and cobalt transport protein CorA [Kribbella turkmenica]|uniref:Magnesium and cobalt transport protein CorA n=1 Tax=Kribbella turkmenica TaxID=2530375 RepID=A0A4R4WG17_9ACTN|nr:magnesium and cobalt transport protein CorA [Kribbella turkmenica]TDD15233.1 magnesium and cobalt transport protein CorA [Kribbella turkmenica]
MIVHSALYGAGQREPVTLEIVARDRAVSDAAFAWIDLHEPTDSELRQAQDLFGLHDLAVEDAQTSHQRPKIERYGDALAVVLCTLHYLDEVQEVETGQASIFIGSHYVVTVWHGDRSGLEQAHATLNEMPAALTHGPAAVLWAICDAVVDHYESVTGSVEADVDQIETAVFGTSCTSEAERIYMLKREVLEMRRAVVPLREPIERFAGADVLHVDSDAAVYFRNVAGHVARVCERTDSLDRLLDSALDAHIARVSVQQNDDIRRISAWVAIAAGPTVISTIYGMNFENIPELRWRYGYFVVICLIATGCIALYASFRRSGWL